jgi:hypothetical protein
MAHQPMQIEDAETSSETERRRKLSRQRKAVKWRDETIIRLFSEVRRGRPLEPHEKEIFDRACYGLGPKRDVWRWSEKEDRRLLALIARRARTGRPAPFTPNTEVLQLAMEMGRSYMAVHRRIERLRKRMKCSDARTKAKG